MSIRDKLVFGVPDEEDGWRYVQYKEPSDAVQELRTCLNRLTRFQKVYDLCVIANGDVPHVETERTVDRAYFLGEIRKGRLLHKEVSVCTPTYQE